VQPHGECRVGPRALTRRSRVQSPCSPIADPLDAKGRLPFLFICHETAQAGCRPSARCLLAEGPEYIEARRAFSFNWVSCESMKAIMKGCDSRVGAASAAGGGSPG